MTVGVIAAHEVLGKAGGTAAYRDAVLADMPWGFWEQTETSGSLADATGNGRSMAFSGSAATLAQTGPDAIADAVAWASAAGFASTAFSPSFINLTFEAWVYLSGLPATPAPILAHATANGGSTNTVLWVDTAGKVNLRAYRSASTTVTAPSALSLNTWHHVVGSATGNGAMEIRVDKSTVATGALTAGTVVSAPILLRGSGTFLATRTGAITIAYPAAYNAVLTDAQTDAHYDAMMAA